MPRESRAARQARVLEIITRLRRSHPDSKISLDYGNRVQLLVAVILSAQCTDAMVNQVTKRLFRKYRTARDFAEADPRVFEQEIRSTGFYRAKTRNVRAMARGLLERHDGQVPSTMEALVALPGVGRKTANVVLWHAFGRAEGIAVDTHVTRISRLLGLTRQRNPERIEEDLLQVVPEAERGHFTHLLIDHGRKTCVANRPRCERCPVNDLCPSADRPSRETTELGSARRE